MATRVHGHHGHHGPGHVHHPHPVDPVEPGGRMGIHGMIVFGGNPVLLSHIPMMHKPHDVQLILEARLDHPSLANKKFGDALFTLVPETFSLDDLRSGRLTTFKAQVFSGNFENGGRKIADNVVVTVKARHADAQLDDNARPLTHPRYVPFGTPDEAYLVKKIVGGGDYDQITRVKLAGLTADEMKAGVELENARGSTDVMKRLQPGDEVTLRVRGTSKTVTAKVEKELSVLVGPEFVSGP